MATTTPTTSIDPTAIYRVDMIRPVRRGAVLYRPGVAHQMTGAMVLDVAAAGGASGSDIADLMTATRIE